MSTFGLQDGTQIARAAVPHRTKLHPRRFRVGTVLILALDTSSPSGSLAVLRETTTLAHQVSSPNEQYSASLLRDTKKLLDSAAISFEQIDLFAVGAGPGSFSGLRVGLTAVKGWAEVWRRPVAAVSGLEAMATQLSGLVAPNSLVAAVMDARRGQIYGGMFRRRGDDSGGLDRIGDEVVATADEFLQLLRPHLGGGAAFAIACTLPEVIRPALDRQDLGCGRIEVVSNVLAPFIGQLGYAKAVRGDVVDALHLDANYIRRSDAEMNWKGG
jgi:tRNA threonylcarbamoyladenosine biosynthesis protein TsaB